MLQGAPKPAIGPRCHFCHQPAGREQKFCGGCGAVLTLQCERTHATVVLIDVCGFTSMSERLDPEDVRAIMERTFDVILDSVHAYGGRVNQFLGDGAMALFGAVDGADHHAIRALLAAAAIQDALGPIRADVQRDHSVDFHMRVGVHTGPLTLGVIGHGLRNDYVSPGETTSIAARLVTLARADQIVVSARTRELTAGGFGDHIFAEVEPAPLRAWALTRESGNAADVEVH